MLDWQNINTWQVLVIEDVPDNRLVITEALRFFGMTVKVAKNGEEGLEVLQSFTPTIILLDLSMPRMDGWEMFKHLKAKKSWRTIPVVALTAHAMPEDKHRVLTAGFDGYLTKPINMSTLINDLRATLEAAPVDNLTSISGSPKMQNVTVKRKKAYES